MGSNDEILEENGGDLYVPFSVSYIIWM